MKETLEMLVKSLVDNTENVEITESSMEDDYKMFMYFVKPGDSVWNIAKKFKVCMNDIIDLNKLENPNKLNVGDRLYIMR